MRRHTVDFYGALYRAEDCTREDELQQGLPRLSQRDQPTLDANVSMEELTAAVGPMASGPPPGLDGLPRDFYKHFYRATEVNGKVITSTSSQCEASAEE
ncbi:hypothetical protein D4764_12G0007740 [Takifugu flavidus]|uniref:Uncharacterized protein n=1 Tax=Takifugu flavidus TaxID=433684 RepID=A0A5C6PC48_9TELE|nr:hypothetical protein D4764_12G0007740 [Takifugu flavidus]